MATQAPVQTASSRTNVYGDRTMGTIFLVFAVIFAALGPWAFTYLWGLAGAAFAVLIVSMLLFQGLAMVRKSGTWLRLGSLVSCIAALVVSPLFVQEGLQSGTAWFSVFLTVLGVLFAPVGVWTLLCAYWGGVYSPRLRRIVTYDERLGL